jgi:hypothetical protein
VPRLAWKIAAFEIAGNPDRTHRADIRKWHGRIAAAGKLDHGQEPRVAGDESRGGNRLVAMSERSAIASATVAQAFDTVETAATGAAGGLERDDLSSNRHLALHYWWSMIFSENRGPLFGIML